MVKNSIIRLATLQAQRVEIYRKNKTVYRFGTVLFDGKNIINTGRNSQKSHPLSNSTYKTVHAEFSCILGVSTDLLRGASLFVLRLTMEGRFAISYPCKACQFLIKQAQIKHLYYTDNDQQIKYQKMY